MKEKNLLILFLTVLILGIICLALFPFNGNTNNVTDNITIKLNDTNDTENITKTDTNSQSSIGSKSSNHAKSSSSVDVEEQELDYTRDQPTKNVDGVNYNLVYGEDNKPSHWESSDGQSNVMPLKTNSKSSSSRSSSHSFD